MPKILFPENAWTLGTLQGVNVVSNRVAPSKEIKVTVTNNSGEDLTGVPIMMMGHPYLFELLDLAPGEPSYCDPSGVEYPFQSVHTYNQSKKRSSKIILPTLEGTPLTFLPGESIQLFVTTNRGGASTSLGASQTTAEDPLYKAPSAYHLAASGLGIGYYNNLAANSGKCAYVFYGDFIDSPSSIIIGRTTGSSNPTLTLSSGRVINSSPLPEGPFLGVMRGRVQSEYCNGCSASSTRVDLLLYDDTKTLILDKANQVSNHSATPAFYVGLNGFTSQTNGIFLRGSYYTSDRLSGDFIQKTLRYFLNGQLQYSWSFSSPEEMYWLSPIIQLPYELNLATINWSEIGGFGRIDVDEFDPQDYEIRYSVEPPEGDAAGTIPDTDGNQLNYWTPNNSWTEAGSWQIKEKNTGGGPMKFVQIRIRFQG